MEEIVQIGGSRVLIASDDGPLMAREADALTFIGDAMGAEADTVAIPVSRLSADFLVLSTRLAGDVTQKFTNYRIRLVIVGDVSAGIARSDALRAFVIESNRGQGIWFVDDIEALRERLASSS